jgi:hypothetical protein
MAKRRDRTKGPAKGKDLWELASVRIGVVTSVIGLIVLIVGLPNVIAGQFDHTDENKAKRELQKTEEELREAAARLDVRYLLLRQDVFDPYLTPALEPKRTRAPNEASTLISFPLIDNGVSRQFREGRPPILHCRLAGKIQEELWAAYLVIQNRGKRDATAINVQADHLLLSHSVPINEARSVGDDYVEKLHKNARQATRDTINIPKTLGPGDGIRVPLFLTVSPPGRSDIWCVVSRSAVLPTTLNFTDPILKSTVKSPVRRLADPEALGSGIEGRG